ncbi:MAG: 50S ribosomal protein L2 [Kiritimatiellae bacterium]|nr:50S ribosomal protein L2 [Kiritimatiellia bacterium]MCO5060938.1 50S ribosomal protein L2 [Kiritimatiellia bacterium]MCO6400833.1 50S ribosomal protein L2 [Verrucomicrobiota bacterium]
MPLKSHRPLTPSSRYTELADFSELTRGKRPEKKLVVAQKSKAGRNMYGRVTVRHRGGGHKRFLRLIDFKRDKRDIPATVTAIEYDPNRSARLALLTYKDGEKRYILATLNMKVGQVLVAGASVEPTEGNALPLNRIPAGMPVHNIELYPGKGAQLVRGAGGSAEIMAIEAGFAQIRLPSGEIRLVRENCFATVGQVGNLEHQNISLGKAGRKRWLGIRPTVRGVAMNPIDHVMGGGEGRSSGGGHPRSPWGKLAKGKKTRDPRKTSDRFIVQRRK